MASVTLLRDTLDKHWPNADPHLKDGMIETQTDAFALGEIDSKLRLAHFLAQASEECGAGTVLVENLNYSPERLTMVWPSRFASIDAATPFAHNPKALANRVYGGRNGNRLMTDDGYEFRGRGPIQVTGRDNYVMVGSLMELNLVANPDLVLDPSYALKAACAVWKLRGANSGADEDSVPRVTRAINGGLTNINERRRWTGIWKAELGLT